MPATALVHQQIQTAIGHGYRGDDFASLIMPVALTAGIELESENADVDDGL